MDNVRSLRNQGWAWFDYAVLDTHGAKIKAAGIAVYMVLARHAGNDSQQAFPAVQSIAEKTGMSDRQVKRVLKTLEEAGLISIEPQYDEAGRQLSNLYTLLPVLSYRGDTQSPSGVTTSPGGGDTQSPKQDSVNKTHRNKREIAPASVTGDIPRIEPTAPAVRDMPTKPVPATPLPDIYPLTSDMQVWAFANVPSLHGQLATEHAKFCAYYRSIAHDKKLGRRANWRPVWELWMTRAADGEFSRKAAGQSAPVPAAPALPRLDRAYLQAQKGR